jgi:hypothetical protein
MFLSRAVLSLALTVMLALTAGACSSSGRRDQNYGKDAGTVYEPPEGGTVAPEAGRDRGEAATSNQDASADSAGDATIDGESDANR